MSRTGHSSTTGVRSYKRISEGLQEMTSSVLNGSLPGKKVKVDHDIKVEQAECSVAQKENIAMAQKENIAMERVGKMVSFQGASHFTVNLNLS